MQSESDGSNLKQKIPALLLNRSAYDQSADTRTGNPRSGRRILGVGGCRNRHFS